MSVDTSLSSQVKRHGGSLALRLSKETTMYEYLELRLHLTARLAQLERHLREIEADRRRMTNPLDPDWKDQAPTRQNDAVLDKLAAGDRQQMTAIRAALIRIAEGTYG